MVSGKGTSKPYIQFIGHSSTDVTGSMHLVRFKKYVTLLDCGLVQLNDPLTNYRANQEQLKKVKPTRVDYIILTHLHIDHSGLIPAMFARGCHAHVYVPFGCKKYLRILWEDSMKIMQSDCDKINHKHGLKTAPFYSLEDIDKALTRCIEVPYYSEYVINTEMTFAYIPAGHIIHSAQVVLTLHQNNIVKRIGYTGDIGGTLLHRPYTKPRQDLPFVDVLIGENTYNYPTRPNRLLNREKDLEKITTICSQADKILIPTFSLGRTQEMLYELRLLKHNGLIDLPVYLDSPLSQKFCDIWDDDFFQTVIMTDPNLHQINSWEESQALQNRKEHCVILSASGFLNGGRALAHLKTLLPDRRNHVIFCGYSGENNLASQIKDGDKAVKIDGEWVNNNANITSLYSFSSHASYDELISYYTTIRYNKLCLVHGDMRYKPRFCDVLQDNLISQGKSAKVVCVNEGTKVYV